MIKGIGASSGIAIAKAYKLVMPDLTVTKVTVEDAEAEIKKFDDAMSQTAKELIFIAIMERIAEKIPELSYIDEDYGQLEAGAEEEHYPVTFPCVLIGNAESDWNDLGYGVQKSESLITIRLAIDCYDDTHYTSGTYDKVRERQLKAKELYKALQEFQCTEETSPLVRVKSRDYSLPGNIKVYETVYSFTLHDESAMQ